MYSYFNPPDDPTRRRDVNRFLDAASLTVNALGGQVAENELTTYGLCGGSSSCLAGEPDQRQPHKTLTPVATPGLTQLALSWDQASGSYSQELPAGQRDVSGFQALQFRAGINYADPRNPAGLPQDLSVTLTDGAGQTATVKASQFSRSLFFPPGHLENVPRLLLNMVRLPLSAFSGIALNDVRSINYRFDQSASGSLMITDLAFTNPEPLADEPTEGDPGGPHINKITFSASDGLMVIKGTGLSGQLTMEINGVVVAPPLIVKAKGSGAKAKVTGSTAALNLRAGSNRIRLHNAASLQSNLYLLNL